MNTPGLRSVSPAVTDVYTDLHGMSQLKAEGNKDEALKKVAQQFESMFIQMMMKNMRSANAVFEEGSLFNSSETQFYRDMYDQQLSLTMSHNRGIGIADALYRQMAARYENQLGDSDENNTESSISRGNTGLEKESKATNSTEFEKNTISEQKSDLSFNSPAEFIKTLLPLVKKAANKLGVEPEYLVAQSALETGWGAKISADETGSSLNLFNIKADQRWQGDTVSVKTQEFRFGRFVQESSEFRKYDSLKDSISDYVEFISANPRYKNALEKTHSGELFIQELQNAGYATDPQYADKVSSVYGKVVALRNDSGRQSL